ncbi:unnamed protein product [Porites lobata]|uniref:Uncharacterized protein n=1 Tax=Porites lobata TaxID=104759 RepID=A0ABN8S8E9_9CNID|nr:unnamed protein product [Porites lobata]
MDEDLVIMDVHGFEIMDSESTRGEDFWNVPAKKIYAITLSDCQKKKKNKRTGAEGKTKDINQRESLWIWTCWTKYQRNWMT